MDKLEYYRNTITKILTEYYQMKVQGAIALDELDPDDRLAFDEERDQYLWFRSGWNGKERLRYMTMYSNRQGALVIEPFDPSTTLRATLRGS